MNPVNCCGSIIRDYKNLRLENEKAIVKSEPVFYNIYQKYMVNVGGIMDNYGDNGFFEFMNRLGDIVFLNLIFLLSCIPIITIGDALISLYSVSLKMARGEEGYVIRGYFKALKDNLKQGLIVGILLELIVFILGADVWILYYSTESYRDVGLLVTVAALFFVVMVVQFLFPLFARYENSISNTIRNAVLLSISKLPYTMAMIALMLVPVILVYMTSYAWIYVIFAGISISALLKCKLLNRVFRKIEEIPDHHDVEKGEN